jgi:hypothetical protein
MMKKRSFVYALSIVLMAGCSSVSVRTDYDETADFSALKTYAWKFAEQPETGDPRIDNDLLDSRIRTAIDSTLAARNFQCSEESEVDFQISYFMDYERRIGGSRTSFGAGAGSRGGYGGSVGYNTMIYDYEQGSLTIDIIDAESGKTIWRGVGARAAYSGSNPDQITKITNESVARIFKKFPPTKK